MRQEHEVIGQVLSAVEMLAAQMRAGATVPTPPISGAIDFFASVVERCHEAKEEALFPLLAGLPRRHCVGTGGPHER